MGEEGSKPVDDSYFFHGRVEINPNKEITKKEYIKWINEHFMFTKDKINEQSRTCEGCGNLLRSELEIGIGIITPYTTDLKTGANYIDNTKRPIKIRACGKCLEKLKGTIGFDLLKEPLTEEEVDKILEMNDETKEPVVDKKKGNTDEDDASRSTGYEGGLDW